MNERTRQILKERITSILFIAGDDQVNLASRIAREKIADAILEALIESLEIELSIHKEGEVLG
jgi:hypothetical protein